LSSLDAAPAREEPDDEDNAQAIEQGIGDVRRARWPEQLPDLNHKEYFVRKPFILAWTVVERLPFLVIALLTLALAPAHATLLL